MKHTIFITSGEPGIINTIQKYIENIDNLTEKSHTQHFIDQTIDTDSRGRRDLIKTFDIYRVEFEDGMDPKIDHVALLDTDGIVISLPSDPREFLEIIKKKRADMEIPINNK